MFWGSKKKDDSKTLKKTSASLKKNNDTTRRTTTSTDTQSRNPAKSQTAFGKKIIHRDDLPQLLVKEAHISEQDVRDALKAQEETGVFFGEILANKGILESQSLVGFLAKHCKIPHIGLLDYLIDKSLLALIPEKLCWEHHLIPVDKLGKNLTVAMVNPLNNAALRSVREICPELRIKPILCSNEHFKTVAENLFGKEEKEDKTNSSEVPAPCSESMEEVILPINNVSSEISADKNSEEEIPVAVEEEGHAPLPSAAVALPAETDSPLEATPVNTDKLLESVFGTHKIPKDMSTEDVKEEESRKSPIAEEGTIESIMNSYTDVMVNSMHDTYELLARKISFFNGISPENVAKIFTQGNVVEYEPAQMLFDKGDTGNIMFVILNGRVKIRDEAKQIAILHTGDIFGEMGLVSDAPRSAAAITMIQSDLLRLSIEDILQDIPANVAAQLLVNIIITLAERLRVANQKQD